MNRDKEHRLPEDDAEVIELGSVSTETKGAANFENENDQGTNASLYE